MQLSGYRFYKPELGRWANRDPIGERGGEHLWVFTENQPTSETDALGQRSGRYLSLEAITLYFAPDTYCGAVKWIIRWSLTEHGGMTSPWGSLVQEMQVQGVVYNCDGSLLDPSDLEVDYENPLGVNGMEMWSAEYGRIGTDTWSHPEFDCTYGEVSYQGIALYYNRWKPDPPWERCDFPFAGMPCVRPPYPVMPVTDVNAVVRTMDISWNCCNGRELTHVWYTNSP